MKWMKGPVLGLTLALTATTVWAADADKPSKSQDPDQGTLEDTLQSPAEETMNQPIEKSLGLEGEGKDQETAVPKEKSQEDTDKGTVEDTLQSPAEETFGGQSSEQQGETAETAVPGQSTSVMGKVKSIDEQSGYLTLETKDGKSLDLHADPSMLKGMNLKKDAQVSAQYEKRGDMNHVTQLNLEKGGKTKTEKKTTM